MNGSTSTTHRFTAAGCEQPVNLTEGAITASQQVNLTELLHHPSTRNVTMRFITSARKSMLAVPPDQVDDDVIDMRIALETLYAQLGQENINEAFRQGKH